MSVLRFVAALWNTRTVPSALSPARPGYRAGLALRPRAPPDESALPATRAEPVAELTSVGGVPAPVATAAALAVKTLSAPPLLAWPGTRFVAVLSKATVLPSALSTGAEELPLAGVVGEPPAPLTR